jgi:glycosyltransferase involved in cell wall biosynthesis
MGSDEMNESNGDCLTIVIPAFNEEQAIGQTISQCLAARDSIKKAASLADVEIVVVSDGSTDRTAEIAQGFEELKVIVFEQNRGYGAAIKEGWRHGCGTLVGCLDADGTCDPSYFGHMCRVALAQSADVVVGARLGSDSKMPIIRRIGNRFFAFLLGLLSRKQVSDMTSGMRVVQRKSLDLLYPLPDGLHFTGSMSARAMLNDLRVIEVPMRYQERIGASKLSVIRDGIQFLRAIFGSVLCYRAEQLFMYIFTLSIVLLVVLAAYPTAYYIQHRRLEEWMIYRFVVCYVLGSFGLLLVLATALIGGLGQFGPRRSASTTYWLALPTKLLRGRMLVLLVFGLFLLSAIFLWPGIVQYASTGHITLHWSRLLAGSFTLSLALQSVVFAVLIEVVALWKRQQIDVDRY